MSLLPTLPITVPTEVATQEEIDAQINDTQILTAEQKTLKDSIIELNKELIRINGEIITDDLAIAADNLIISNGGKEILKLRALLKRNRFTDVDGYKLIENSITILKGKIKDCEDRCGALTLLIPVKEEELRQARLRIEGLITVIDGYEQRILDYNSQNTLVKFDISDLTKIFEDLQKKFDEIDLKNKAAKQSIYELDGIINTLNAQIEDLIEQIYTNKVYNNQNLLKLGEYLDASLNYLFSYLKNKSDSSDVIYQKIDHRSEEHQKLHNRNKLFDTLYYCFYFSFMLIMICMQNIKREYFLFYLFIGLIPFIYPFLFKFVLFLIQYLSNNSHGPKKAFVDINNTILAFND